MIETVRDRVIQVMSEVFECSPEAVTKLRAGDSPQWDSVAAASLVIALEDTFGVILGGDSTARMTGLDEIVNVVETSLPT
jgi:acyl carrier protein